MAQKNAHSLDSLDKNAYTDREAKRLEAKIDDNFSYFQQHSGSLFVRSLLPGR